MKILSDITLEDVINAATGYQVAGGASSGNYLRGNGSNFVSASLAATDLTGTIASARISGSYTGITGVGTLTAGTWNATTIGAAYGGTGQTTYDTGELLVGNGGGTLDRLGIGTTAQVLTVIGGDAVWSDTTLDSQYTDVGNVGAGEDDLMTYTVAAGKLSANGDRLIVKAKLENTTAANSKSKKFYIFGTVVFSRTDGSSVGSSTFVNIEVIRVDATTARVAGAAFTAAATDDVVNIDTDVTATLANSQVIKGTGTGTNNDDVLQHAMTIEFKPTS